MSVQIVTGQSTAARVDATVTTAANVAADVTVRGQATTVLSAPTLAVVATDAS